MHRRSFLTGMAGILAAGSAPWVVTKAGVLMPVKARIWTPRTFYVRPVTIGGDGLSWDTPFNNIQAAISASSRHDTIVMHRMTIETPLTVPCRTLYTRDCNIVSIGCGETTAGTGTPSRAQSNR